jgi:glycine oxidase
VNVLVIGAGIIGVSIADALAARGARVTVFDMRSPGRGASQASAGMLAPYTEAHDHPELLGLGERSLASFDNLIEGLRADTGREIEYARSGSLEVAFDAEEAARLGDLNRTLAGSGVACQWLDSDELARVEPGVSRSAIGGLLIPSHGLVGVDSLLSALVHRATFAGAIFETPVEVTAVEQRGHDVEVRVNDRVAVADAVVIAGGSWSRRVRVANIAALPIRPVRGQLLHLRWRAATRPGRVVWGPGCYTVPWSDNSLLVGATVEEAGFEESTTVAGVHALTHRLLELLPDAATASLEAIRVGLRPATVDGLPAIGPLARAPGVVVATGHFRNGILLAPLTAELVTRCILDREEDEVFAVTTPNRLVP